MNGFLEQVRQWQRVQAEGGVGDAELLRRFLGERDEAAFELLVFRHGGMVLSLCRKLLRDDHEAEDAFQATFLVLACKARSVAKKGCVGSWLYKVAYRLALRQHARRARLPACVAEPAGGSTNGDHDPLLNAARQEATWMLAEEIERLSERLRRAIVLCCLEGKSSSEAARELGCSVNTISTRLMRARLRLRRRLQGRGLAWPAGGLAALFGVSSSSALTLAPRAAPLAAQAVLVLQKGLGQAALSSAALALAKGAMVTMAWNKAKLGLVGLFVASLSGLVCWQAGAGAQTVLGGSPGWASGQQERAVAAVEWQRGPQGLVNYDRTVSQTVSKRSFDPYPKDAHLPAEARRWIDAQREVEDEIRQEAERKIRDKRAGLHRKLQRLFDEVRRDGDLDQAVAVRDQLRRLETSIVDARPNPGTLAGFPGRIGQSFVFAVVGEQNNSVWGTDVYSDDSPIAVAAVHAGALKVGERGLIRVTLKPGQAAYEGSTRNGVTTFSYGQFERSYVLERANLEIEADRPARGR